MAQIVCKNLAVGYGNTVVKSNINFNVEKGDYLCIIGENGCGKSTLMKTILGLENAIDGEIVFSDDIKKNEIGYLPQQTQLQRFSCIGKRSSYVRLSQQKRTETFLHKETKSRV